MPIDYSKYPSNWKTEIRPRILARAGEVMNKQGQALSQAKCEFCGVENYSMVESGYYIDCITLKQRPRMIVIVLTIAHLDHDEENHEVKDDRLAALCQRCHLQYDAPEKARRRKLKTEAAKSIGLFNT